MLTKCKFNVGDTVYITLEAAKAKLVMREQQPSLTEYTQIKYFELGKAYKIIGIIKDRQIYYNYDDVCRTTPFGILVEGSAKYIVEDYFSKDNYKTINIENMASSITHEDNNSETFRNECEQKAKQFTDESLRVTNSLLSDDYKLGYKEGIEKYLIQNYNTNEIINNMRKFSQEELNQKY